MRRTILSLLSLLAATMAQAQVSLSQAGLSDRKVYTVVTTRGGWYAGTRFQSTKDASADVSASDSHQQFAFVTNPTDTTEVYLYSVGQKQFVKKDGSLVAGGPDRLYIFQTGNATYPLFFSFTADKSGSNINIGGSNQMTIDTWSTYDAGNQCQLTEVSGTSYSLDEARELLTQFGVSAATQGYQTTGQGNDTWLLRLKVTGRTNGETRLDSIGLRLKGATERLVSDVRLYATGTDSANFYLWDQLKPVAVSTQPAATMTLPTGGLVIPAAAERYLWITATVRPDADFGETVDAAVTSIATADTLLTVNLDPEGEAKIFKQQKMLMPWFSFGTKIYRIPALIQADDGTIVVVADDRRNHGADAGSGPDDLVYRYSTDGGLTWSDRKVMAKASGDRNSGVYSFGDPVIGKTPSGKLVVLSCATSRGFWDGQQSPYIFTSTDGGRTWDEGRTINTPETFTDKISGTQGVGIFSFFATSGRLITTSKGRMMCAVPVLYSKGSACDNYIIYSDDEGATWTLDNQPIWQGGGNETKLVERKDHSILASIRQGGGRGFNIGSSDGMQWMGQTKNTTLPDPGCNEDIIAYGDSTMLIHTSLVGGRRANLHIYTSHDQGKTWKDRLQVQPGDAAYSTMEVLKNGDLAIFYEDGSVDGHTYDMNYIVVPADVVRQWEADGTPSADDYAADVTQDFGAWFDTAATGYFTLNPTDKGRLQPLYDRLATKATVDDYFALRDSLSKADKQLPPTGCYRLQSAMRAADSRYGWLNAAPTLGNVQSSNGAASVVRLTANADGTYSMQVQGQYIQVPTRSQQVALGTTPVSFTPHVSTPGQVAFVGNASDAYSAVHMAASASYNIVGWTADAGASQWKVEDATSVTVPAKRIDGQGYAAVYLPFATRPAASAATLRLSDDATRLVRQEDLEIIPAATPALIHTPQGATTLTLAIEGADTTPAADAGVLKGSYLTTTIAATDLVLKAQGTTPGFYKAASATSLGANTAYVPASAFTVTGNGLPLDLDTETGIMHVDADVLSSEPRYNLQGQRVGTAYKGIVIEDGKKLIK